MVPFPVVLRTVETVWRAGGEREWVARMRTPKEEREGGKGFCIVFSFINFK